MSTILENATNAINSWNEIRNNGAATNNYFNQGSYFPITATDFATWQSHWESLGKPENFKLHAYLGISIKPGDSNFCLSLYCVDSATDKKEVSINKDLYLANMKYLPYSMGNIENATFNMSFLNAEALDPLTALQASTQWSLHKNIWLEEQTDMAQILVIPFNDLETLFVEQEAELVVCLPALKMNTDTDILDIDLILWGHNSNGIIGSYPADLIRPKPPFKNRSNYQLLSYALQ